MQVEIIGTDGKVHYRRPHTDRAAITEALRTPGYSVRWCLQKERSDMQLTTNELESRIERRLRVLQLATNGGLEWIAKLSARMLHRYAVELLKRSREQPTREPICS